MIASDDLRPLLPEEQLEERAERVVEAFEAMLLAREQQEEQRVIDSTVDPEAVERFRQSVRSAWAARRLIGPALLDAGMYEVAEDEPLEKTRFGIQPELIPKSLFIPERPVLGGEWRATDIGRGIAEGETRRLAERAFEATEHGPVAGTSLAEQLRGAIAEVGARGEKVIVIVPLNWRLTHSLELALAERRGGEARPPRWVPEEEADESFVGTADDVPVFDSRAIPSERIAVIAVDSFARWRQWQSEDGHEIHVSITEYNEACAREVRKAVLLEVYERFNVAVIDSEAARWLNVPEELRGH